MKKSTLRLERMREAHAQTDRDLEVVFKSPSTEKLTVTCSKGCSACCSEPVYAEKREAELAAQVIEKMPHAAREEAKAKIRQWLERVKTAPEILAKEMPGVLEYRKLRLPCPLLKGGLCSIYQDRPWGCRLHNAVGPRENCEDDARRLSQMYAYVPDILAQPSSISILGPNGGTLEMDHFGLLLAEVLLGERVESAGRALCKVEVSNGQGGKR